MMVDKQTSLWHLKRINRMKIRIAPYHIAHPTINCPTMSDCEGLMIKLNIENLKPGMILARPVRNHQGVLLLEADAKISKKNIHIFKSWGILEISIKGNLTESEASAMEVENKDKESLEKQLKEKFSDVLDDPVMLEIFNAARNLLMKDSSP